MSFITARKRVKIMYEYFRAPQFSISEFSRQTGIDRETYSRYKKKFTELEKQHPGKPLLLDKYFHPIKPKPVRKPIYYELIRILPEIMADCPVEKNVPPYIYDEYKKRCPDGYSFDGFRRNYQIWKKANNICVYGHRKVAVISDTDNAILNAWRNGTNLEEWRKAVVIQGSFAGIKLVELHEKVEIGMKTLHTWITKFKENGIEGLIKKKPTWEHYQMRHAERTKNVMKLIHEPPNLHGMNRASWSLADLTEVYNRVYGEKVGVTTVRMALKRGGYRFKKAKMVLTSPDPKFREKLDKVKGILSRLTSDEKFFSMDEFGPFAIKMKSGWSFLPGNEIRLVPQAQKSKGWLIFMGAIELSTNQVTHFYCTKKNSDEVIRLIDILLAQYHGNKKLYVSGDAASWHSSIKLKAHLDTINHFADMNKNETPYVELVPLPASSQFLNVIESVFSGLAKSVIHNSDYASVDECKFAIDRYFEKRNDYFKKNPKRAGRSIWGKELVKSTFDESQNCKDPVFSRIIKSAKKLTNESDG